LKPLIGITCAWDEEKGRYYLNKNYADAVFAGGGIPVPLAYSGENSDLLRLVNTLDGIVFSGGPDVDPVFFGEEPIPAGGEICPERDLFEISLAKMALAVNIPVLGICRGMQVVNISAGGDIYQDMEKQISNGGLIKHFQQAPGWHPTHRITVSAGSELHKMLGRESVMVNSFHHQAVRKVAPGFIVTASSADGVCEAIELPGTMFTLCVQFHPETIWSRHSQFLSLFDRLVQAGLRYNSNKTD